MRRGLVLLPLWLAGVATPALAATESDCQAAWQRADANSDGVLTDGEAARYGAMMRIGSRKTAAEGRVTQGEFMEACKADAFAERQNDPGAPLKGSNSFTEGQARDRALAHGVESVSGLKKDDDGIWRGAGTQAGKPVQVAVDYKGNVVTTVRQ